MPTRAVSFTLLTISAATFASGGSCVSIQSMNRCWVAASTATRISTLITSSMPGMTANSAEKASPDASRPPPTALYASLMVIRPRIGGNRRARRSMAPNRSRMESPGRAISGPTLPLDHGRDSLQPVPVEAAFDGAAVADGAGVVAGAAAGVAVVPAAGQRATGSRSPPRPQLAPSPPAAGRGSSVGRRLALALVDAWTLSRWSFLAQPEPLNTMAGVESSLAHRRAAALATPGSLAA